MQYWAWAWTKGAIALSALLWGVSWGSTSAFAQRICPTAKSCYDRGTQSMISKEWGAAALFFGEARELMKPRCDSSVEHRLAISEVHSIREAYQREKAGGSPRAEQFFQELQQAYLGSSNFCPTHAACIRIAGLAREKGDFQTALVNAKRALFRDPGSKEANGEILVATIKICNSR
ncbi:hypothetical protein [Kamptonema formosum]|uniref:hypothetical protein n=1 Tax=Kamptonema formosum TaxID=331992 RepID=UPI0012DC8277|nr:hypothetical protein [Oscillatoria sp. PCC 10802]